MTTTSTRLLLASYKLSDSKTQNARSSTPVERRYVSKNTLVKDGSNNSVQGIVSVLRGLDTLKPELFKFDGNPMYYTRFMMNFEASIKSKRLLGTASKLLLLIQYCEGEARKLIEYCAMLEPELGYKRAKEVPRDNVGRPNVTARAYIDKLSTGSLIKADDVNGLVKRGRDFEECNIFPT